MCLAKRQMIDGRPKMQARLDIASSKATQNMTHGAESKHSSVLGVILPQRVQMQRNKSAIGLALATLEWSSGCSKQRWIDSSSRKCSRTYHQLQFNVKSMQQQVSWWRYAWPSTITIARSLLSRSQNKREQRITAAERTHRCSIEVELLVTTNTVW